MIRMSNFEEALDREIAELEQALESDPRYLKLRELKHVASLYRRQSISVRQRSRAAANPDQVALFEPSRFHGAVTERLGQLGHSMEAELAAADNEAVSDQGNDGRSGGSTGSVASLALLRGGITPLEALGPRKKAAAMREGMIECLRHFLKGRTEPVRTVELYEVLRHANYTIPGDNPRNNLSAILSRADDFVSHGKAGWTLADERQVATVGGASEAQ